jgi:hypothetical protein
VQKLHLLEYRSFASNTAILGLLFLVVGGIDL